MERILGFYESYCKHLYESYSGDGTVLTIALISGKLKPNMVLNGLNQLQHRHPLLQAVISESNSDVNCFEFSTYSMLSLAERLEKVPLLVAQRSDSEHWKTLAESVLTEPIENFSNYLWRFVYLYSETSDEGELFLYSRHDISDARSTTHLMNDLIAYCSNFDNASEMTLSALPILPSIERQLPRKKDKNASEQQYASEEPTCNWPYVGFSAVNARNPICVFYKLNEYEFDRIKKAAKAHGVTINSVLATALMLAQKFVYCPSDEIRVRINTAISLREYCEPALSYEHFGCYVMNVSTAHFLALENDFWSASKAYGEELLQKIEEVKACDFLPVSCDYQEVVSAVDNDALFIADKMGFQTPMITNSGLLSFPKSYKTMRLRGLYVGTKQVFGDCGMVLSTLTLNGEMFFMFSGCEPLVNRARMNEVVDKLFLMIRTECDIV